MHYTTIVNPAAIHSLKSLSSKCHYKINDDANSSEFTLNYFEYLGPLKYLEGSMSARECKKHCLETSKPKYCKNNILYHNSVDTKKHKKATKSISNDMKEIFYPSVAGPGLLNTKNPQFSPLGMMTLILINCS